MSLFCLSTSPNQKIFSLPSCLTKISKTFRFKKVTPWNVLHFSCFQKWLRRLIDDQNIAAAQIPPCLCVVPGLCCTCCWCCAGVNAVQTWSLEYYSFHAMLSLDSTFSSRSKCYLILWNKQKGSSALTSDQTEEWVMRRGIITPLSWQHLLLIEETYGKWTTIQFP